MQDVLAKSLENLNGGRVNLDTRNHIGMQFLKRLSHPVKPLAVFPLGYFFKI